MLKWILILILVVGAFFTVRNWSTIMAKWGTGIAQLPGISQPSGGAGKTGSPDSGISKFLRSFDSVGGWGNRTVAGITLDLPFSVSNYTPSPAIPAPPHVVAEYYRGGGSTRALFIKHETNTAMAGEIMLAWQNRSLASEAARLNMQIMSANPATTVINGYRARRTDMIGRATPQLRARMVTYERGNQVWFVQFTALESDAEGEQIYQRIANSAR